MDVDEDDDFYAPEETVILTTADKPAEVAAPKANTKPEEDLEEGEEEDEGGAMDEDEDDSDIDIITERKDGTKAAPPTQSRYSDIRNIPQRSASNDMTVKPAPVKKDEESRVSTSSVPSGVPSADRAAAAASKSKIDINVNPTYGPAGKRITAVNIDEDLAENDKPWRKPGTDISDYFNYGFDEFTWALYAAKQESIRGEFDADAIAANNKKMMEDFGNMMMMGGMPGGGAGPAAGGLPAMPGMEGMPPEMQAMIQQMMGSGMDPSQMDPSAMSAMFAGMQGQAGGVAGQGGQGQNFGQGFGSQGQYGYDQQGMGGGNRGGFGGGRGRGGRRW